MDEYINYVYFFKLIDQMWSTICSLMFFCTTFRLNLNSRKQNYRCFLFKVGLLNLYFFLPSNRKEKLQIHNPRDLLPSYVSYSCLRLIMQHSRPSWNGKSQIESLLRETFRPPRSSHTEEAAVIAAHMKRGADLSWPPLRSPFLSGEESGVATSMR